MNIKDIELAKSIHDNIVELKAEVKLYKNSAELTRMNGRGCSGPYVRLQKMLDFLNCEIEHCKKKLIDLKVTFDD